MAVVTKGVGVAMSEFVVAGAPPSAARGRAAQALVDTVGVTLAGSPEMAATIARGIAGSSTDGPCRILGTHDRASAVADNG